MANFLHRGEARESRLRQLAANPSVIVHFCSRSRRLTEGERAVLNGSDYGDVLGLGGGIKNRRVCKAEEITEEEFARAPDIADTLEKLLPCLPFWNVDKVNVQVVRLEKR